METTRPAAPARANDRASTWASWLMLLLSASALTTNFGVHLTLLLVLLSLGLLVRRGFTDFHRTHARVLRYIFLGFGGFVLVTLLRMLWFGHPINVMDGPSRLLFALACIGFVGILRPNIRLFWVGMCIGTIVAAVQGGWQFVVLGEERVTGITHHAITYGDLAVAMGVMSFCALSDFRGTRLAWLPPLALLCGMLAAIFSGSRGAWLGFLLVLWPMLKYGSRMHGKTMRWVVGLVLLACAVGYLVPQTGIAGRAADAVSDVERYYSVHDASTNVGTRLELWKAAGMMIAEHPFAGVGRENFRPTLLAFEKEGRLQHSIALTYSSAHNDVLHTLATGGLLDLVFLLLMYGAPFVFFSRMLHHGPQAAAAPALAGMLLVILFVAFGLTDVMFWLMRTQAFYATMVCVLAGFCLAAQSASNASQVPHALRT
ncbi:O-antigen ligase [Massilia sp. Mn16-1_5]|uniref:O-antigen ligase family protein n=1 Tax=Massilia sp. Mn16-1_5 TaxID=2079199 RepID=UPI001E2C07F2|nr:O-antigen ligase family protein [Massilia sp. Mn16-1_5]